MNLEVRVALRDETARPLNTLARALAQLTGAIGNAKGADTALSNIHGSAKRLRGVFGTIGTEAKTASVSLSSFARVASRLATNAGKAADNVGKLKSAMTGTPADSFLATANAQLREMLDLQRRACSGMRALNSGGGRRGMANVGGEGGGRVPGVALALQPHAGEALRSVYEQATSLQDSIVKMHLAGLSDSEIAAVRAKADEVAKLNKSTTPLANINALMEARLALGGDLNEALATAGEMSKLRTIVGFSLGKDRAKSAEDGVYDMLRTGEIRGLINDPSRRSKLFQGMTAALIASNGRITPRQWHQTAIYGRSATQGLSDEFENNRLPFLMQELQGGGKGGQAGVALQALFRAIPLAITKATNIAEWRKLGFIDESKIVKGDHGSEKALPGAITLGGLAISDPDQAVFKLLDSIKAHGTTDRGGIIQKFAQLIGTGTGQSAVDILGLQRERLENFSRTLKQVEDSDTLFSQINATASQTVEQLDVSMKTLSGNIGSMVIPSFTSMVDAANRFVGAVNGVASVGGKNGNDPINGQGGGLSLPQLGLIGGGAAFLAGKLATRFPFVGRLMSGAAGSAITGSPWGAALEPMITSGTKLLASKIPEAIKTGVTSGLKGALIMGLAYEGGKALIEGALSLLPKPQLSPEKQSAYDAHMRRWNDSWIWQKPGLIWEDAFGTHETTAPTTTISGKRARGGPVAGGLSYLVGEHGPEVFTPGASGAITANHMLRHLPSGTGAQYDGLGSVLAQALRFQTFALVQAIHGIREHGYVHNGGFGGGGSSGSGSGGSSGSGGGGYGRGNGGSSGAGDEGGDGGTPKADNSPLGKAGMSGAHVAEGKRAFGLNGWRDLGPGGRARFMAGSKAGHLGVGTVDSGAFTPHGSSRPGGMKGTFGGKNMPVIVGALQDQLLREGVSADHAKAAAAVLAGNVIQESGGDPNKVHDSGTGFGIYGARLARRSKMFSWLASHGYARNSAEGQARYMAHEAMTAYGPTARILRAATAGTLRGDTIAVARNFESPAERYANYGGRASNAVNVFNRSADMKSDNGSTNVGAFGLGGFNMPSKTSPDVPEVLKDHAKKQREHHERARQSDKVAKGGHTTNIHVGGITVHASPNHDHKQVAEAVHKRFNEAAQSQLHDGIYG